MKHIFLMKTSRIILAAISVLLIAGCSGKESSSSQSLDELFATRRSVRAYESGRSISEQQVRDLLSAVQNAPSWANQQPSKYYVAMSPDKVSALLEMIGSNKDKVKDAPVLIVSTFEKGKSGFFRGEAANEIGDEWGAYDNGLSNAYLVLKARDMGFDTLIMGMRDSEAIRSLFSIPENEEVMAVISLGYRAENPGIPTHRSLDEVVKFF